MPNIDFSKVVTAAVRAQRFGAERREALKAEAVRRIEAVWNRETQLNLIAAVVAGDLSPAEMAVFRASRRRISETLAASRGAASTGNKPEWPERPQSLVELASKF